MMWSAGGASRLLEVDTTDRSYDNFFADEMEAYKTAAEALASERGRLLSAVGNAVNAVLSTGLTSSDGLRCDAPVVRDLFLALEASLEHHLLPPLFSLGGATLWYCLVQVQQASRRGHAGNGNQPSGGPLQLPAEAVALAITRASPMVCMRASLAFGLVSPPASLSVLQLRVAAV